MTFNLTGVGGGFPSWTDLDDTDVTFSGLGTLTWTVDPGDITTLGFFRAGNMVTFLWQINNSVLGGVADSTLRMALPSVLSAVDQIRMPILAAPPGLPTESVIGVKRAGNVNLEFVRFNANWPTGAFASIAGQLTWRI